MPWRDKRKNAEASVRWRARLIIAYRAALAARQLGLCEWCAQPLDCPLDGDSTHIDHVQPLRQGGMSPRGGAVRRAHYSSRRSWQTHSDGLRLLHADCNMERSDGTRFPLGDDEHGRLTPPGQLTQGPYYSDA